MRRELTHSDVKLASTVLLAFIIAGCSLTLPFAGSVSSNGPAFSITNTSTSNLLGGPNGIVGASDGAGYGVLGISKIGIGVNGRGGDTGVFGTSGSVGVHGISEGSGIGVIGGTNTGTGVYGESGTGTAVQAAIILGGAGNLFVGCVGPLAVCLQNMFRVDSTGKVFANGGYVTGGADVAEFIQASDSLQPGDVAEVDPNYPDRFRRSGTPNSTAVAGVISTDPGVTLNAKDAASSATDTRPQLALVGRAPVKVSTENGPIHPGDLLVASSIPGHAMRAPDEPAPGAVIGKALGRLGSGTGVIQMLLMLR